MLEGINRQGTHSVKWDYRNVKFGTDDVLPLWVADMDLASALCVQESIKKRASHPIYGYTIYPDSYYFAIKNWMKKRFDFTINKEWIVPCYGVVPSINFAISAYSNEGDGVLVQTPLYPPFVDSIKNKKRIVLDNRLLYRDGRYTIDFEDFEEKAKKATLFLLCSPHNPTGRSWDKQELEKLIAICIRENVLIISDEIHADMVYEKVYYSIGSFKQAQEHCVVLNAPSKTFNIAGLNTSYAIIPNSDLRDAYQLEQDKSGITNGNPFGVEALIAAYEDGDIWLETVKTHLISNINYVKMCIKKSKMPLKVLPTEASFLIWIDCKGLSLSQEELVSFFINDAKLGLNDGLSFGSAGIGFMRLNIGISFALLEKAMQRLIMAYSRRII